MSKEAFPPLKCREEQSSRSNEFSRLFSAAAQDVRGTKRLRQNTIKSKIGENLLGIFINPDEIEAEIKRTGFLDFRNFGIKPQESELIGVFQNATFLKFVSLAAIVSKLSFVENKLSFADVRVNSYFASAASDFIHQTLVQAKKSFLFETVMSSPDEVEFLNKSRQNGYRNYLYYVATDDPLINISRVEQRVREDGNIVPKDKIETRYYRSLDLLLDAVKLTNRAYTFDNSDEESTWIAEITEAEDIEIKQDIYLSILSKTSKRAWQVLRRL